MQPRWKVRDFAIAGLHPPPLAAYTTPTTQPIAIPSPSLNKSEHALSGAEPPSPSPHLTPTSPEHPSSGQGYVCLGSQICLQRSALIAPPPSSPVAVVVVSPALLNNTWGPDQPTIFALPPFHPSMHHDGAAPVNNIISCLSPHDDMSIPDCLGSNSNKCPRAQPSACFLAPTTSNLLYLPYCNPDPVLNAAYLARCYSKENGIGPSKRTATAHQKQKRPIAPQS